MSFLRRISTRHLLLLCAGVVAVVAGGTALAIAAGSGGAKPAAKSLPVALRDALAGPAPAGVTAHVTFTNNLIDSGNVEGSSPLLSGADGRIWVSSDGHFRLELQSTGGDAQVVSDGKSFFVYDASANTVYRGQLPKQTAHRGADRGGSEQPPTLQRIQAETLAEKGIEDVEALAAASVDDLVEFLDVSMDEAETIKSAAMKVVSSKNEDGEASVDETAPSGDEPATEAEESLPVAETTEDTSYSEVSAEEVLAKTEEGSEELAPDEAAALVEAGETTGEDEPASDIISERGAKDEGDAAKEDDKAGE